MARTSSRHAAAAASATAAAAASFPFLRLLLSAATLHWAQRGKQTNFFCLVVCFLFSRVGGAHVNNPFLEERRGARTQLHARSRALIDPDVCKTAK